MIRTTTSVEPSAERVRARRRLIARPPRFRRGPSRRASGGRLGLTPRGSVGAELHALRAPEVLDPGRSGSARRAGRAGCRAFSSSAEGPGLDGPGAARRSGGRARRRRRRPRGSAAFVPSVTTVSVIGTTPAHDGVDLRGGRLREVDDPSGDEGAAVVDPHADGLPVLLVRHVDDRPEGEGPVGGGDPLRPEGLAAGRRQAGELGAVPRGEAVLDERRRRGAGRPVASVSASDPQPERRASATAAARTRARRVRQTRTSSAAACAASGSLARMGSISAARNSSTCSGARPTKRAGSAAAAISAGVRPKAGIGRDPAQEVVLAPPVLQPVARGLRQDADPLVELLPVAPLPGRRPSGCSRWRGRGAPASRRRLTTLWWTTRPVGDGVPEEEDRVGGEEATRAGRGGGWPSRRASARTTAWRASSCRSRHATRSQRARALIRSDFIGFRL